MAQVTSVVSESLQAKIRSLLPSQAGFTEDLQAQNVIVPIIDLTETASGSVLRQDLQTAINFGGTNSFNVSNTTTVVANTPGFWRFFGVCTIRSSSTATSEANCFLNDGASNKVIFRIKLDTASNPTMTSELFDFIFFLNAGHTLSVFSGSATSFFAGHVRQVADLQGNLVNPTGFTLE